jgi:hypothetical protein
MAKAIVDVEGAWAAATALAEGVFDIPGLGHSRSDVYFWIATRPQALSWR